MKRPGKRNRKGTAVVELAIVLPILVLLIIVPIEISTMLFVRQSLSVSAYESIRVVTRPGGSYQSALDRANEVLNERNVTGGVVAYTPSDPESAVEGTIVTVTITAPSAENATLPLWVFTNLSLTSQVSMIKE